MKPVKRFLEYRKVQRFKDFSSNLEQSLREAWSRLPTQNDRIVPRFDGSSVMGFSMTDHGQAGVSIHCVRYVDQQGVGIIPMAEGVQKVLGEKKPLADENFLDRDFFLLAWGDHVISLNASTGAAMARTFLAGLIKKAGLPPEHEQFNLVQAANVEALNHIKAAGGVRSFELNLSLGELAADFVFEKSGTKRSVFGGMLESLSNFISVVGHEDGAPGFAGSEKGSVRLMINVPEGDVQGAKMTVDALGRAIVDDEDAEDYVITLNNGDQIRRNSMALKKSVNLKRNANSFVASDVEAEMLAFMRSLIVSEQTQVV